MQSDVHPRLGHRGGVGSRAMDVLVKSLALIVSAVALVGAFFLSVAFFVVAFAVVLVVGGYLWWKTRDLRRQMRAQMQVPRHEDPPHHNAARGNVIEGVVISRDDGQRRR